MKIDYQIFEEEKLLVQKFTGDFSIEEYVRYIRQVMSNNQLNSVDQVLIDFRDVIFEDIPDDFEDKIRLISEIRKNINENEVKRDDVKLVFWVDKPIHTVIAHMFIENLSNRNYYYCTTIESVLDIMPLSGRLADLENVVKNLENTFS